MHHWKEAATVAQGYRGGTQQYNFAQGAVLFAPSANQWTTVQDAANYGDGSDGIITLGTNTVASRTMYYAALNVGAYTLTSSFPVFVQGVCTLAGGSINNNGNAASGATAGAATSAGIWGVGAAGGNGGSAAAGSNGSSVTAASLGGAGAAGGVSGGGNSAGTAGTVTAPVANDGGIPRNWYDVLQGRTKNTTPVYYAGGAGGSGGGSGSASVGGGGGGGGGILLVVARIITGTGTISCNGGAGAAGTGTNAGGGGGGGGGACYVVARQSSITPTATGGAPGTAVGTGVAGSTGSSGTAVLLT